jgi:hypothetical protein
MKKLEVLHNLSFGNQIAEEEKDTLKDYFVQTNSWRKILNGDIDIIYGVKGAGKSAIYVLIQDYTNELFDRRILLVSAENVRGDPAFKSLTLDPPTSEREFINLWKLYFVTLIARTLVEFGFEGRDLNELTSLLRESHLLPARDTPLSALLKTAQRYVRGLSNPAGLETTVKLDPVTGMPTAFSGKIIFDDPAPEEARRGIVSISKIFSLAQSVLEAANFKMWLLLDRLDIAFDESSDLERNALRALFRAYRDIRRYDNLLLKIFLRTDIWERVTDSGFREATHISRDIKLQWNKNSLLNLMIKRLINNQSIVQFYDIRKEDVLEDSDRQADLFYRVFPDQVEVGEKQSSTIDWLLKRITDARNEPAPREIIFFLNQLVEIQAAKLERGEAEPDGHFLFDRSTMKEALPALSEYRTTKVLFSEYPEYKSFIEALRGEKAEQTIHSLSRIWRKPEEEAWKIASKLSDIGFFEERGGSTNPTYREGGSYWVPFIYRPFLALVQGRADDSPLPLLESLRSESRDA